MTAIEKALLSKIGEVSEKWVFRGQENSNWKLYSAATRRLIRYFNDDESVTEASYFSQMHLVYHRAVLLDPARKYGFGNDNGRRISDLQLLAKLQHFGAATGLLDFTRDPLVALWLACGRNNCDGRVFILDLSDKFHFQQVSEEEETKSAEEIFAQTISQRKQLFCEAKFLGETVPQVLHQRCVSVIGRPLIPDEVVSSIVIEASEKALIRQELLDLLDIDIPEPFADIRRFSAGNGAIFPLPQVDDPEFFHLQGNQCFQRGEFHNAISYYDKFIELAPDVSVAYSLRGIAKAETGEYSSAKEDFDLAIRNQGRPFVKWEGTSTPSSVKPYYIWPLYFNRGNVKAELNDLKGALEDYNEAVRLCQQAGVRDSEVYFNRGNVNALLHISEDGLDDYDNAILLGNTNARYNKGNLLVTLGRFDEALQCYDESIEEGIDRSGLICNRNGVEAILNRIGGSGYVVDSPQYQGSMRRMTVEVSLRASDNNLYTDFFNFHGIVGNTGNAGEDGLPSGKGYKGRSGFVVLVKGQEWI